MYPCAYRSNGRPCRATAPDPKGARTMPKLPCPHLPNRAPPRRSRRDRSRTASIWFGVSPAHYSAFHDTGEPDETSFRALRPKTLRLTLDVTETVSCYSQSARTILGHMQHHCFVRGAAEVRQVWGSFRGPTFRRGGGVIFGFHTELPLVVGPTPTRTPDLRLRPRRRRPTRRCRGSARGFRVNSH